MKKFLVPFVFIFSLSFLHAQDLKLKSVPDFFKNPVDGNFLSVTGVATNSKGHIFVFNKGTYQLMEFDTKGNYIRSIGKGLFMAPHGLRIDKDDNIWTTDLDAHTVLKFDPEGKLQMVLGNYGTSGQYDSTRHMVLFFKPADIAFGSNDDLYIADGYGNSRIVQLDKNGKFIRAWGEFGEKSGQFNNPHNIVIDSKGDIFVADRHNSRIQVFSKEGNFKSSWNSDVVGKPWGLTITPNDEIYMSDGDAERVLKLDTKGNVLATFNKGPGNEQGQFRAAHGIAVGKNNDLYVTEVLNWRVQKFIIEE
ncbi:peptidyl-alpha-hydroxyglycine alpha-amidating lyase family protein [Flexithrix dorotheae]|uniref:peptidyl-alpha-hydroxyglycine alpha-amidating lyase family protein n=1 Tax=Flexithrix dorotheae TaxID=70993 RepID=UPI00037FB228|nr:peptidyl-alpha-hydroxyglycine alpha-amidating lyase family protein [Flexithrix dorotheae]